ncbi:MAG TPA: Ig-like domain-containing protein [Candidatus Acidoferrum sp.]|nr:Ig-like domain-containing protein [Candidatus Acidoferrum sp.]
MTDRRGARPSQVRPRAPSNGRPAPPKVRLRPAAPYRPAQHKRVDRGPGLPLVARALLAIAVIALGAVILYGATGQIAKFVSGLGSFFGSIVTNVTTTPSASPSLGAIAGAPTLDTPSAAYTNESTVDISGTVPLTVIGQADYTITLYQQLPGQQPSPIQIRVPIPATATFTIPGVKLIKGSNSFTATIVGPGGEGPQSSPITYVLDTAKPKLTITSPKDSSKVNGSTVDVKGKTQAGSSILAQNTNNHTSSTATADNSGSFTVTVAITPGTNTISVTATDPATNVATVSFSVVRGSGKLTVSLTSNLYTFSAKKGASLTFTATLTDPDGNRIANQDVTFTIALAGVAADVQIKTTDAHGTAIAQTQIGPHAADLGAGKQGTVTISADTSFGHIQKTIVVNTTQ